ncbi:conserved hypothetical protein [Solidesulfovibrio fructosivorans JJ]]|uniref:Uncharacterized protein n=1 Tax=Solidesulfovibrio fructosivorans JJ] TaxID=596151 RepID=E1K201_SOLFR|nr:hypothetical protein [Solidesulfovibrio fructosivorans]EFL49359.1 conserved hypothetical protein [Solidesulfovibrio fructosivorans JJ]]
MNLNLTITGMCCDLALHPVDDATAARVCLLGENLYKTNSLEWWRASGNNTCGMRLTADSRLEARLGDKLLEIEPSKVATDAVTLTQRECIDSGEDKVCLLGYDDESCSHSWTWSGVEAFDPAKFHFIVQRWDHILGVADYLVLEDVLYDGRPADGAIWGQSEGFTFREPLVVGMDVVRAACGVPSEKAA